MNCIHHLLSLIPYEDIDPPPIAFPDLQGDIGYLRPPMESQKFVPDLYK